MRNLRNGLALIALAIACSASSAQNREWADKLFKDNTSHDFGNVPRGGVLSYKFTLTNIYAVPLEITGTRVSCGCVTVTPSSLKIGAKETATIDVTMDARRFTGQKTVSIYITVGPQFTSTATLQVSANSRADVVLNPGSVNFGIIAAGQAPQQSIDVEYAGAMDWKVESVKPADDRAPLEVTFQKLYGRQGGVAAFESGYRISVKVKPGAPPGSFRWELLAQTNDKDSPNVPILVEATVQAALTANPGAVKFPIVKVGQEASFNVALTGRKPFKVTGVEGAGDGLTVDYKPDTATTRVLTLRWKPEKGGEFQREVQIKTDLEDGGAVTINVKGTAEGP
jgi:hypothetical protein